MSPIQALTGSSATACRKETAEGPPAPVTRILPWSATARAPSGAGRAGAARGRRRSQVGVADHFQRLGVAGGGEAAPVARRRPHQLLVEVAADRGLRGVGVDQLQLALEEVVDRDEAVAAELDRRRG